MKICNSLISFNSVQKVKTFYVNYLAKETIQKGEVLNLYSSELKHYDLWFPIILYLVYFINIWNLQAEFLFLKFIYMLNEMYERYLCWTITRVPTGFFCCCWKIERVFREKSERSSLHANTWFIILDLLLSIKRERKKTL